MDNESKQRADEIVAQIKELVKKGNIARILVKRGEDTVLNMALSMGAWGFASSGGDRTERARDTLRLFSSRYGWNGDEIAAAPLLWHYITALFWGEVQELAEARTPEEAAAVLARVEGSLGRSVSFADVMGRKD